MSKALDVMRQIRAGISLDIAPKIIALEANRAHEQASMIIAAGLVPDAKTNVVVTVAPPRAVVMAQTDLDTSRDACDDAFKQIWLSYSK